jgi:oxygen-independent coproporphyrinogen III oxidase
MVASALILIASVDGLSSNDPQMSTTLTFDLDLLSRYDRPGPRYTSYPTAPQFTGAFGESQLRQQARRTNEEPEPRPLSVYLHIPFCSSPCFYCGCNRIITRDQNQGAEYLSALQREIVQAASLFDQAREVLQIHIGGGTPNFLRAEQLAQLMVTLRTHFNLSASPARDFSIELDPRCVQPGDIERLAQSGFNRVSFGVQDFTPTVQEAINRVQSVEQTLEAIATARACHFRSVNVDLIYGLPHQSPATFETTLKTLLDSRPERFAIYGYAHMPHLFKAQRKIHAHDLPDSQAKLELLQLAVERLTDAGYRYIGMDHFAVPEDDLSRAQTAGTLHRNFMGYTTHADCDLIGLGVSAISHVGDSFSQNARDMKEWKNAIEQNRLAVSRGLEISRDDSIRAAVIQQIMCQGQIDIGAIERRFEIDFLSYFSAALHRLHPLVTDGLACVTGNFITATARGRLLMRVIAMCFDNYLKQPERTEQQTRLVG